MAALGDESPSARWHAVVTLGEIANKMEDTAPMQATVEPLAGLLTSPDSSMRSATIDALAKVGRPAADTLIDLLGDTDSSVRSAATKALGQMGEEVTELLIAALSNPKSSVRKNAAAALERISPDKAHEYQVTQYISDLKDPDAMIRATATRRLGLMGNLRAVESLITALDDSDYRVRMHAAEALGVLGDKRAISALDLAKKDKDNVKAVEDAAKDAAERLKRLP